MKGTRLMLGLVLVSLAAVGLTAAVEGCGQGVPTCDSVCALGAESPDCTGTCTGLQSTCGTTFAPDFQAYLTCNSNAGGFSAGTAVCAAIGNTVSSECHGSLVSPTPGTGSGTGTSVGSGTTTTILSSTGTTVVITPPGAGPACSSLAACCNSLPISSQSSCEAIAQVGPDEVLPAPAPGHGQVGRAHLGASGEAGQGGRVLVVGVGGHVQHGAQHLELVQERLERRRVPHRLRLGRHRSSAEGKERQTEDAHQDSQPKHGSIP